ncbi:MAG: AsmA family protein [Candidatus Margulisbacteria bacterium]|nr:AsmA family protein [Candidatus Margulisiibacteriota bacterium]
MKIFLRLIVGFFAVIFLLVVIGFIVLPLVFPADKIKDFAAAKLSEMIRREVKIEKASFDLFSGIKLQGLSVSNRTGFSPKPFVKADAIVLRYAFWPLFSRQIIIKEISLVKPEILVEKSSRGDFNFSDLTTQQPNHPTTKPPINQKRSDKPPFDLFINAFSIKDGRLSYIDKGAGTANDVKNLNLKISGFALALVKPIDLNASAVVTYQGKDIPVSLGGQASANLVNESVKVSPFFISVAGEKLTLSANISAWKSGPNISFSASSGKFEVDPLLALFAGPAKAPSAKPRPGELTKTVNQALASLPRSLKIDGNMNISNLTFQGFKVDKIDTGLSLANKNLTVTLKEVRVYGGLLTGQLSANLSAPGVSYRVNNLKLIGFNSTPFFNDLSAAFLTSLPDYKDLKNKVYGNLDLSASLSGRGVEPQDVFANLDLNGSLSMKNGELKRIKSIAEVGKLLNSNTLQTDIKFGSLYTAFALKDRVASVKDLKLDVPEFKLFFKGGADLKRLAWVAGNRLTLKLAPSVIKDLPKEYSVFKDKSGWLELTFELTGSLQKPLPKPILDKPIEVVVGKVKAEIEAKKVELVKQVSAEVNKQVDAAKKSLEEEAKRQLKDLIKF